MLDISTIWLIMWLLLPWNSLSFGFLDFFLPHRLLVQVLQSSVFRCCVIHGHSLIELIPFICWKLPDFVSPAHSSLLNFRLIYATTNLTFFSLPCLIKFSVLTCPKQNVCLLTQTCTTHNHLLLLNWQLSLCRCSGKNLRCYSWFLSSFTSHL